jgi:hypothetical protein
MIQSITIVSFLGMQQVVVLTLLLLGDHTILSRISIETSQSAEACYACFIILELKLQIILNRVKQKLFLQLKS